MKIEYKKTIDLIPYVNNTRTHSEEQINQIALEYVTSCENSRHAVDIGLISTGKNHHNTKTIKLTKDGERKTIKGWEAKYE